MKNLLRVYPGWILPLSVPFLAGGALGSCRFSMRRGGLATFVAFLLAGAVPLLPAGLRLNGAAGDTFVASSIATGLAFLFIGLARGRAMARNAICSALETLAIGGAAAAVAYLVGFLLRPIQA